jgi:hypothetical protein
VDIFAQRQHVWIARPTLKAIDQEQSLATVHHAIAGSPAARSPPLPMSHYPFDWGVVPHRNLPERRPRTDLCHGLLGLDLGGRQIRNGLAQEDFNGA